jgi:hypothetical protein
MEKDKEEQQIKLLEFMGWVEDEPWLNGRRCFIREDSNCGWEFDSLPNYVEDLNAIHEVEKQLTKDEFMLYNGHLGCSGEYGNWWNKNLSHASASQRVEQLLKIINLRKQ